MLPSARGWRAPEPVWPLPAFRGYPDATHVHRRLGGALLDPLSPRQFRTSPMLHRPMGGALRDPVWPHLPSGDIQTPLTFIDAWVAHSWTPSRLDSSGRRPCSIGPWVARSGTLSGLSCFPVMPQHLLRTSCPPPRHVCLRPGCSPASPGYLDTCRGLRARRRCTSACGRVALLPPRGTAPLFRGYLDACRGLRARRRCTSACGRVALLPPRGTAPLFRGYLDACRGLHARRRCASACGRVALFPAGFSATPSAASLRRPAPGVGALALVRAPALSCGPLSWPVPWPGPHLRPHLPRPHPPRPLWCFLHGRGGGDISSL
ncbi:hypothetical protein CgunFtcFv8_027836 [Champsocephalus gunnari]|uniref:Uncharacterized protein n=1 Tax=Champsocephalus gunnari TaxID=52237 RepID=A0AAN8EBG5_CHAGU|nr:hypothetical protein CgunFtcFv8_027836 [Champsocephalus gunnari]